MKRLKGHGVGRHVAIGLAYVIADVQPHTHRHVHDDPEKEIRSFQSALSAAKATIEAYIRETHIEETIQIFMSHIAMLDDQDMKEQVESGIRSGLTFEDALQKVKARYLDRLQQSDDAYLLARTQDIEDVFTQIWAHRERDQKTHEERLFGIAVKHHFYPSEVLALYHAGIIGFVAETGSALSHSAMIAESLQCPMVFGIDDVHKVIRDGSLVCADGEKGEVIVSPTKSILEQYVRTPIKATDIRPHPSTPIEVYASINFISEIELLRHTDISGIGLVRTEYLFHDLDGLPGKAEQVEVYRAILGAFPERNVIIRAFDKIPDMHLDAPQHEDDVSMRGVKTLLAHRDVLSAQLEAMLKASSAGKLKILLPMVTSSEAMMTVRKLIECLRERLIHEGADIATIIPLGAMIETPLSLDVLDDIIQASDFVAIGSNDLLERLLSIDRDRDLKGYLSSAAKKTFLDVVRTIASQAKKNHRTVGICGRMAEMEDLYPKYREIGIDFVSVASDHWRK
jgi:phosphotransferase system enzyme I (PtsI)